MKPIRAAHRPRTVRKYSGREPKPKPDETSHNYTTHNPQPTTQQSKPNRGGESQTPSPPVPSLGPFEVLSFYPPATSNIKITIACRPSNERRLLIMCVYYFPSVKERNIKIIRHTRLILANPWGYSMCLGPRVVPKPFLGICT